VTHRRYGHGTLSPDPRERSDAVLQVTDSAIEAVKAIVEQSEVGATGGLRIAVDETDESVELGVEESAAAEDTVIDQDGARVFLDAPSARALEEMVLDANAHDDHFHFELFEQEATA
jgi:Fe-S cluster assembly iron-binding protein IscA